MGFQEVLHTLEEGGGRKILFGVGAVLAFFLFLLLYSALEFRGLAHDEAMDQAQLARNIARGDGYTTSAIRPLAVWQLSQKGARALPDNGKTVGMPETLHPPLYPLVLAAAFKATGQSFAFDRIKNIQNLQIYAPEKIMAWMGVIFYSCALFFLFKTAESLFDSRVAWLAVLLAGTADLSWQFCLSGLCAPLLSLLLISSVWAWQNACAEQEEGGSGLLWVALAALLQGALPLVKYSWFWVLPASLLFVWMAFPRRAAALGITLIFFLLPSSLWFWRNHVVTGNLLGLAWFAPLAGCAGYPGDSVWATLHPDFSEVTVKMLAKKWVLNFRLQVEHFMFFLGSLFAGVFFWASLMHRFKREHVERLKWWVLLALALLMAGYAWGDLGKKEALASDNGIWVMLPVFCMFAGAMFFLLLDRLGFELPFFNHAVAGLCVVLNAAPLVMTLLPPRPFPVHYPPYYPPIIHLVSNCLTRGEVMASDLPVSTAWYGDRMSLLVPNRVRDFFEMNDFIFNQSIKGVLFSPVSLDGRLVSDIYTGRYQEWAGVLTQRGLPPLFPLQASTYLPPMKGYFFICDSPRWTNFPVQSKSEMETP